MAEENQNKHQTPESEAEIKDRGVFDFLGKKKEGEEEVIVTEFEKVTVSEPEHKPTLLEKLHRSDSSSSSSSEEEGENGEKRKKKKKEKKEKKEKEEDTSIEVEKVEVEGGEEKKGFLEKIKEKLPGGHKKTEEGTTAPPPPAPAAAPAEHGSSEGGHEKKGILEKIKEKLPGYHPKTEEEKEKEKEKESANH